MRRPDADPFSERAPVRARARLSVLGGDFEVESSDTSLLQLARDAFLGLPRHRLVGRPRRFHVRLVLSERGSEWAKGSVPPPPVRSAGAGLLCATVDAGNFAIVDTAMSRALVCISPLMLRHRYHARTELVELAFLTLASRAQRLVPLHAACVGTHGNGLLLIGAGGTGKSTLSLHALAHGLELISEDSAFVSLDKPLDKLRVTGTPNYLHVQPDSLGLLSDEALRERIASSPVILRRSGIHKLEVDLRALPGRLAPSPLELAGTVMLSPRPAGRDEALRPLDRRTFVHRLRQEQPYAAGLDDWTKFERRIVALPSFELRRTEHPDVAVDQLRALLRGRR